MDAAITCDTFLPNTSTNNRTPVVPTQAPVTASNPTTAGNSVAAATSVAPETAATPLRPANVAPLRPVNEAALRQPELSLTSQKELEDHAKQIEEALEISTVRDGAPPGLVATLFIVRS
eukprot:GHVU01160993.1.p2 GENE.GHVU01160993.1~~GHVU01160993.1.p2  ORF type:complete len:119 (+),score=9.26 GHVU01160993.1:365-721(+)